ncbi:MAG: 50S ribosomal protein L32 [Candidatus Staskawiczbacteria bacterium]|nr:50S ribosomal protein L32 [Candidatus Staskawiczbacteria bacterium]
MAVPKRRRSSSASRQRRMHIFINPAAFTLCKKCGKSIRPHVVCSHCGFYKGKEVINVLSKLDKKEKKHKEKEIQELEKVQKKESPLKMDDLSKQ